MGYLIGGAEEGPEKEIVASKDNPYAKRILNLKL